jgi:hypothetical protein
MQHGHMDVKKKVLWNRSQTRDSKIHWTQRGQQSVRAELPIDAMADTWNCRNISLTFNQTTSLLGSPSTASLRFVMWQDQGRQIRCLTAEQRRRPMCVQHKNEAPSYNHCCSGKAMSITYCECVFVALVTRHAVCMRHIVICGLPRSSVFFHIIPQKTRFFREKKSCCTQNSYFHFFHNFCLQLFSF